MRGLPSRAAVTGLRVSRRLTAIFLAAFVAECTLGSSGRWLVVGPLSVRMLLFIGCMLASIPIVWERRRYLARHGFVRVLAAFGALLGASALWATHLHNSRAFIVADLTTMSALLLVPPVLALRLGVPELERLLRILFWGSVTLAIAVIALHVAAPSGVIDVNALGQWLSRHSMGGLALAGGGVLRIYLRSEVLFIPALLLGIRSVGIVGQRHARLHRSAYLAGSAVVAMGLVLSLTRSLWIGCLTALVVFFVWCARDLGALLRALGLVAATLAVLLTASAVLYGGPALLSAGAERLSPGLARLIPGSTPATPPPPTPATTGTGTPTQGATTPASFTPSPSTTASPSPTRSEVATSGPTRVAVPDGGSDDPDAAAVEIRAKTLVLTKEKIRERPLTGWGIGYNLDAIRDDGRTEYLYWDLLMKVGAPGLLLFLVLYAWTPVGLLRRRAALTGQASAGGALSAALAGIAVTSYFNPFLNSTLGIVVLVLLVATAQVEPEPAVRRGRHRASRSWRGQTAPSGSSSGGPTSSPVSS